jgi:hypothetical protein
MVREPKPTNGKTWVARILIGLVLLDNFQAAVIFLVFPARISPGFGMSGVAGNAVIQGIGLLFLMWCVPYFIATLDPRKHKISFIEAIVMQTIALVGESVLLVLQPAKLPVETSSVQRFILFDGTGLFLLVVAAALLRLPGRKVQ